MNARGEGKFAVTETKGKGATYADAGVDINAGNRLVDMIKPIVSKTFRPGMHCSALIWPSGERSVAET